MGKVELKNRPKGNQHAKWCPIYYIEYKMVQCPRSQVYVFTMEM